MKKIVTEFGSSQRRTRLEIVIEVLNLIKDGTKKPTHIMYGACISWKSLMDILGTLISKDLIKEYSLERLGKARLDRRTPRHYEITEKGLNVLNYFRELKDVIANVE